MAFPPDKKKPQPGGPPSGPPKGPPKGPPQGPPQGGPGMPPGADPMAGPGGLPGMDPTSQGIDPMLLAGMNSPLAQAGMPMLGGPPQPPPPGMQDPMADPNGPPGMTGAHPGMGDPEGDADSPLLAALMGGMGGGGMGMDPSAGMEAYPGGDIDLQGLGPQDPSGGLESLLSMLALSQMGVTPGGPPGGGMGGGGGGACPTCGR